MHRWSRLFIPTLREAPADAEVASHKFLVRSGYIRQLGAGIYSYLFLGQRSINKIIAIVREEMDKIGQEFLLPGIMPSEIWKESGRWTGMGQNMFRLQDRKGAELCLGMTHEEVVTDIARKELRSYKQLPQIWYQIQTKFRDEPRPKAGLLRVRTFIMKDSYSFDLNEAGLDVSYKKHDEVYRAIFTRAGLSFVAVEADSGAMGGSQSQEFMVYTEAGEDLIVSCPKGDYAANLEKATSRLDPVTELEPTGDGKPELVHTPGKASIADVAEFFQISPAQDIKTVAYMGQRLPFAGGQIEEKPIVVFLRGDHEVNETKLASVATADSFRPMVPEELDLYFKGPGGFLGPIGLTVLPRETLKVRGGYYDPKELQQAKEKYPEYRSIPEDLSAVTVVLDKSLEGRENMVAGANKLDYHYRNVTPGRDFGWTVSADIRSVVEGEACPVCGSPLKIGKAVEVGHIFKLGRRYTESMWARVLDPNGKEVLPTMGC
ncbi:MAG: proline--tRNA ligase, partial [Acidobacteriaceae bacterium]|nr:proline--tRNA ligase [Acidobacteriaceae bacterium]